MATPMKNPHAVALGRQGGRAKTPAKAAAARRNAQRAGRPRGLHRLIEDCITAARRAGWRGRSPEYWLTPADLEWIEAQLGRRPLPDEWAAASYYRSTQA